MSIVKVRYFTTRGDLANKLIQEAKDKISDVAQRRNAFLEDCNADAFYQNAYSIEGICTFSGVQLPGFKKPMLTEHNGKTIFIHVPAKNTKIGKEFVKKFSALTKFNFSRSVINTYNVSSDIIGLELNGDGSTCMFRSTAGFINDTILIKIPFYIDEGKQNITIPETFVEIKKSQFIALSEED